MRVQRRTIVLRTLGGLVIVVVSFGITLAILQHSETLPSYESDPACKVGEVIRLRKPFSIDSGYAYSVQIPSLADVSDFLEHPERSTAMLCENGKPLGPPHSSHDDIRHNGAGLFSHWDGYLLFSTSDNSNPNSNGRIYSLSVK